MDVPAPDPGRGFWGVYTAGSPLLPGPADPRMLTHSGRMDGWWRPQQTSRAPRLRTLLRLPQASPGRPWVQEVSSMGADPGVRASHWPRPLSPLPAATPSPGQADSWTRRAWCTQCGGQPGQHEAWAPTTPNETKARDAPSLEPSQRPGGRCVQPRSTGEETGWWCGYSALDPGRESLSHPRRSSWGQLCGGEAGKRVLRPAGAPRALGH